MDPRGVERPVPASKAFGREDAPALHSQAATLLLLRAQVRRDAAALSARAGGPGRRARARFVPPRDLAILADIGDQTSRPILTELTRDSDRAVAEAARQALRVLDAQSRAPGS